MPNGLAGSAQVSYPLVAPSGTAGAPSYSFAASPTSGMYLVSANEVGFSIGGTGVWYFNSSGLLLPYADNSYDIGISILRPRSIYAGTSFLGPDGSAGVPSYSFASDPNTGMYLYGQDELGFATAGGNVGRIASYGFVTERFFSNYGAPSAPAYCSQGDQNTGMFFNVGAVADTIGLCSGGNLTVTFGGLNNEITVRSIGTITHSGAVFAIGANAGDIQVMPAAVGSVLNLGSAATYRWQVTAAGHFVPYADNTYDIGGLANRVQRYYGVYGYFDGFVQTSEAFWMVNTWRLSGGASSGIAVFYDWAATSFVRLCFGGLTAAFPAIARDGANLALVPADGSAGYIDLTVHDLISSSVYLSNIVSVGANNTYIALGAGGATHSLVNTAASFIIQVTGGAVLATFAGTGYLEMTEVTAPSAPAANKGRLYFEDNGAGKTRLMCLFGSGAAQQIAIEP